MKILTIVSARTKSKRLPNKALLEFCGSPMILFLLKRMNLCTKSSGLILYTTTNKEDDILENISFDNGFVCFRGHEEQHIKGKLDAAKSIGADTIVRVTGDNPFTCPYLTDILISRFKHGDLDYIRFGDLSALPKPSKHYSIPEGVSAEVFSVEALEKVYDMCTDMVVCGDRLAYMFQEVEGLRTKVLSSTEKLNRPQYRLTVDYMEDYQTIRSIYNIVGKEKISEYFSIFEIIKALDSGKVHIYNERMVAK